MIFKSIRSSLAAYTSVAILLACTAIIAVSLSVYGQLYLDAVEQDVEHMSEHMAGDLSEIFVNETIDSIVLTETLQELERYDNLRFAAVLDTKFESLESFLADDSFDVNTLPDLLEANKFKLGMQHTDYGLLALSVIGDTAQPRGYLVVITDIATPLGQSKRLLLQRVVPIAIVIILLIIFLSSWQNYRMLLPLKQLAEFARRIKTTNDYSIKLDISGKREVKALSEEISSMVTTIGEESSKNKAHTEKLKQQQQAMEQLANYDLLTGLPNRISFLSAAAKVLANIDKNTDNPALLSCDLDGFKAINDLHGHAVGDKLLIEVSQRLKNLMQSADVVSRIGADEFLILLVAPRNNEQSLASAQAVADALSAPFHINEWEINIGASIGIASAKNSDYEVSQLISNADIAMFRAKLSGNHTYAVFERDMMSANKRRLDIANAIPNALKLKEFDLFYQAKVNKRRKVVGFEALLRWDSQELGTIPPDEFIPIAEQSGRMTIITHWVINKVCEDLYKFQYEYGDKIVVALNLSAYDLKEPDLIDVIKNAFKKHNINPKSIEFEVTESAFLDNFEQANQFFDQLAKLGSSVALDDFGTGYSSLSYLTKIKFNTLKIDKQFIDDIGISKRTTLVTKTIIDMAKNLNLSVCAEGVETEQQMEFLVQMNCEQLQGYYFSKPQPIELLLEISLD